MHESPWYVLHVNANHEKRVSQHLVVRAIEHYLPLYKQNSRWTDRVVELERPLFPGYVFVRFSPQERLAVISTPGVLHLLSRSPADMVRPEELDMIRRGLSSGCKLRPHPLIGVGTKVRVCGGAFEGVTGFVAKLHNKCRVVIAFPAVQQCYSLEIGMDKLEII